MVGRVILFFRRLGIRGREPRQRELWFDTDLGDEYIGFPMEKTVTANVIRGLKFITFLKIFLETGSCILVSFLVAGDQVL